MFSKVDNTVSVVFQAKIAHISKCEDQRPHASTKAPAVFAYFIAYFSEV